MSVLNNQKVRVYSCGGAGINIGKVVKGLDPRFDVAFLDSSESNLDSVKDTESTYLIRDMDGAGKLRAKTYEAFKGEVDAALTAHKPSTGLNVVISSLSGGTGSVIAPLVAKQLIEGGNTVIVVGIASASSVIELNNTINSVKTYNNFAIQAKKPIAMFFCDDESRSIVDKTIVSFMVSLSVITDRDNTAEFDSTDLHHFINYDKVTSLPVGLSNLHVSLNDEVNDKLTNLKDAHLASTILITTDTDTTLNGDVPEYLAKVIVTSPDYLTKDGQRPNDIRIDNIVGLLPSTIRTLEEQLSEAKDRLKTSRIDKIEVVEGVDDTGMVL